VNRSQEILRDVSFENDEVQFLMIQIYEYSGEYPLSVTTAVPIKREGFIVTGNINGSESSWSRTQYPIQGGFSLTIFKSQSLTLDKVVIDVKNFPWNLSYKPFVLCSVAISRTKKLEDVLIMHRILVNQLFLKLDF